MGLTGEIGGGPVALDTAAFIYLIEEDPRWVPLLRPVFAGIDEGRWQAVTSALTLLEVLVVPYRNGDQSLAERYEALLTRSRGLDLVPLDRPLLRAAAALRATVGLKTPDAIQIAAGLARSCTVFVTNDRRLPEKVGPMRIAQLAAFAGD